MKKYLNIHKEGYSFIWATLVNLLIINGLMYFLSIHEVVFGFINLISIIVFAFTLYFFRNPESIVFPDENAIYAPADGKITGFEDTFESDYLNEIYKKITISILPTNVHVTRYPVSGITTHLKESITEDEDTWMPKYSTGIDKTTVLIKANNGKSVLINQIAQYNGRKVSCFTKEGTEVKQGDEMGFVRLISKVEVFIPQNAQIKIKIGDVVKGNQTILARF
jgi:phosphatidylserine decarboxylase